MNLHISQQDNKRLCCKFTKGLWAIMKTKLIICYSIALLFLISCLVKEQSLGLLSAGWLFGFLGNEMLSELERIKK